MVNLFLNAVTKQLGTTFGNSNRYYVENVQQGITKPCFTIDTLLPLQRSRSAILYDRTMPLVIHWFGDSKETIKKDCYDVAERAIECLEYLPFNGSLLRGEDISWQIVDDVLQIFITYKFITRKATDEEDKFETFNINSTPRVTNQ
jgi:hypothetical protein